MKLFLHALALAFVWPALAFAQAYGRPIEAPAGVSSYRDHAGPGLLRDWACGTNTYDGHRGTDIAIGGFAVMDAGSRAIYAAADGVVVTAIDGCFDRCTTANCGCGGGCGNYVKLAHADGRATMYCHMKKGTVAVSPGQHVSCGQVLGYVGSSGNSTGPHLHFEPRYQSNNTSFEPFAGPCGAGSSAWLDQGSYNGLPGLVCSCVAQQETCNGVDDDCDGAIDEGVTQNCGTDVGECEFGTQECHGGQWGECTGGKGPSLEHCDELDNDCDGSTDDEEVCELEEAWQASLYDDGASSDINGDGLADVCAISGAGIECRFSSGNGFRQALAVLPDGAPLDSPSVFSTLRTGDVTGDGRSDVCVRTTAGVVCWSGAEHGLDQRITGPPLSDADGWSEPRYFSAVRLADVDGDGRIDLCARGADGLRCYPSTGSAFGPARLLSALSDEAGFDDVNRYGTLRLGDVDGDGRADVCARDAAGMSCWRSEGTGFSERVLGPAWTDDAGWHDWHRWSTIRLADVDGDGRADLCARESDAFRCHLSNGTSFDRVVLGPALPDDEWLRRDRFGSLRLGDVDGDRRADLCARNASGIQCWLFGGNGFDHIVQGPALTDEQGWTRPEQYRTLRLADVDGDRRADLCGRSAYGLHCFPSQGGAFAHEIPGPVWSDQAGWSAAERYHTIRVAGYAGSAITPGSDSGGGESDAARDGGCACRAAPAAQGWWSWFLALLWFARRRSRR
jgi:hypothetical protein